MFIFWFIIEIYNTGISEDGITGQRGDVGLQGPPGRAGLTGLTGPAGFRGETGFKGEIGYQGQSIKGERGDEGFQGPAGATGADGFIGPDGDRGIPGFIGPRGPIGPKGLQGMYVSCIMYFKFNYLQKVIIPYLYLWIVLKTIYKMTLIKMIFYAINVERIMQEFARNLQWG